MRLGLVECLNGPSAVLSEQARSRLNLAVGDYVVVACDERDTSVIRQLKPIRTRCAMRDDFVYLDAASLALLTAQVDDEVEVKKSDTDLDFP